MVPRRFAPVALAPVRFASARFAPDRLALERVAPLRVAPARSAKARFARVSLAPDRSIPVRFLPLSLRPDRLALAHLPWGLSTQPLGRLAAEADPAALSGAASTAVPRMINAMPRTKAVPSHEQRTRRGTMRYRDSTYVGRNGAGPPEPRCEVRGHRGGTRGGAGIDKDKGAGSAFRRVRDDLAVRGPPAVVEAACAPLGVRRHRCDRRSTVDCVDPPGRTARWVSRHFEVADILSAGTIGCLSAQYPLTPRRIPCSSGTSRLRPRLKSLISRPSLMERRRTRCRLCLGRWRCRRLCRRHRCTAVGPHR